MASLANDRIKIIKLGEESGFDNNQMIRTNSNRKSIDLDVVKHETRNTKERHDERQRKLAAAGLYRAAYKYGVETIINGSNTNLEEEIEFEFNLNTPTPWANLNQATKARVYEQASSKGYVKYVKKIYIYSKPDITWNLPK